MSALMRKLLESQGIYMNAAGAEGGAGGGGAAGANDGAGNGSDAGQANGGNGDRGNGDGDEGGDEGEGDDPDPDAKDGKGGKSGKSGDKPTDREAQLLKDTMKWKEKARTLEEAVKQIQEQLGDVDPATARKLADEAKERERADLEKKGEYDRIVQQMRDENAKLVEKKSTELTETQQQLKAALQQIENLTIGTKFRESEFVAKQSTLPPTIAQKEFGDYFEFKDGQMVPYDKPRGAAERTMLVDANGAPKPFDQALAELYGKHPDSKSLIRTTLKPGAHSKSQADLTAENSKKSEVRGIGKIEQGLKDLGKASQ